jgi:putative methionine-R-sulfoxide reductase with GAF domain
MFELKVFDLADKAAAYAELELQLGGLLHGEKDFIANCANTFGSRCRVRRYAFRAKF